MKRIVRHRIDSEAELREVLKSLPQTSASRVEFPDRSREGRPRRKTKRMKGLEYSDAFKFDLPRYTEELMKAKSFIPSPSPSESEPELIVSESEPEEPFVYVSEPKQFVKPSLKLLGVELQDTFDFNPQPESREKRLTSSEIKQLVRERLNSNKKENS